MSEQTEKKARRRRTIEQRIAEIDQLEIEAKAKLDTQLRLLSEKRKKLAESPTKKKQDLVERRRFDRAVGILVPGWTERHMLAAIARAKDENVEVLLAEGEALMEEHGKSRGGRRPRSAN